MKQKAFRSLELLLFGVGCLTLSALAIASFAQEKKGEHKITVAAPLSVQDHEVEGVEVALLEVKRTSGNTLTIRWQYRNKTNEKKQLHHGAVAGMDSQRFAKDAYYLDANNKKHTALKDEQGRLLAATHEQFKFAINLAPKQTVTTWARFPAPPSEVEKLSIHLPGASPFEDIGISK